MDYSHLPNQSCSVCLQPYAVYRGCVSMSLALCPCSKPTLFALCTWPFCLVGSGKPRRFDIRMCSVRTLDIAGIALYLIVIIWVSYFTKFNSIFQKLYSQCQSILIFFIYSQKEEVKVQKFGFTFLNRLNKSKFWFCVPVRSQFCQFLYVSLHGLIFGHLTEFLPGCPFVLFDNLELTWRFCVVWSCCGLLKQTVEREFIVIRNFRRAVGCLTINETKYVLREDFLWN